MKIGILGYGRIAGTLGMKWAKAGHLVFFGSRRPEEPQSLGVGLGSGVQHGTLEEAARFGEVAVLTIPWGLKAALPQPDLFHGKVVVDAANPYSVRISGDGESFVLKDQGDPDSSVEVAKALPSSRLVKAFNNIAPVDLESGAFKSGRDRLAIFVAGDDLEAKRVVAGLIEDIGFVPVDTGSLRDGGRLQKPGSPIHTARLTEDQAALALRSLKS